MQSKSANKGFTLIELVFVIVILGILAAFAVPRFVDLTSEARASSLEGLAGSIQSAAALTHAQWLAEDGQPSSISAEGVTITMTSTDANGYPTADATGIEEALQDITGFTADTSPANGILFEPDGATGNGTPSDTNPDTDECGVLYELPGNDNESPDVFIGTGAC